MLRSLFDFRSVAGASGTHPTPTTATPAQTQPPTPAPTPAAPTPAESPDHATDASVHWPALGEAPLERVEIREERRLVCTQRTVHQDGGLQVVDDNDFEEYEVHEVQEVASSVEPRRRVARLRQGGAQITFSVTARRTEERRRPETPEESSEEVPAEALEVEAWVPEWATCELHERQLSEIEVLEAMFPEELELVTPEIREHLKGCLAKGVVSRSAEPLRLQLTQHLDGPKGGCELRVEFSLPPFYPLHGASVALGHTEDAAPFVREALLALQTSLRDLLPTWEGSEVVQKVMDWLSLHGPAALASAEKAPARPNRAEPVVAEPSKADRIEQARKERMGGKFTEKWDLCYAFMKHGSCKDKNCQWRHELPAKKEKEEVKKEEVKEEKSKVKSSAKAGKKKR